MTETLKIIRQTDSKYGFQNIDPKGTKIIAIHSWATGYQELCFTGIEHLKRFAGNNITLLDDI